jgi:hypothetical protein
MKTNKELEGVESKPVCSEFAEGLVQAHANAIANTTLYKGLLTAADEAEDALLTYIGQLEAVPPAAIEIIEGLLGEWYTSSQEEPYWVERANAFLASIAKVSNANTTEGRSDCSVASDDSKDDPLVANKRACSVCGEVDGVVASNGIVYCGRHDPNAKGAPHALENIQAGGN